LYFLRLNVFFGCGIAAHANGITSSNDSPAVHENLPAFSSLNLAGWNLVGLRTNCQVLAGETTVVHVQKCLHYPYLFACTAFSSPSVPMIHDDVQCSRPTTKRAGKNTRRLR